MAVFTPTTQRIRLSKIRFDEAIYPRRKHDPALVQRYAENLEAIEAKQAFISVIADLRIIDGKHRYLAYLTKYAKEPNPEITVHVYPIDNDEQALDKAAELNNSSGWQLTEEDKRWLAIKMYQRATRKTQGEIAKGLSVRVATVAKWLSEILKREQEEREEKMTSMWMACRRHEAIAEQVGITRQAVTDFLGKMQESFRGKDSGIFRDFEDGEDSPLKVYQLWNFSKATNEVKHFGNIPPEIIDNLLWYYTQPLDVVFDPFGGGGSTIDVCLKRKRRYYVSDLNPIKARDDIRQHDITDGFPDDLPVPDLVFLDPPYWKQAEGKYSKDATDLANVDLDTFLDTIAAIAKQAKAKWLKGHVGKLALIIGPWKCDGNDVDLAFLCYERIAKYLNLVKRIIVPYSTEVHGGAFVKQAKEKREILYLARDLMVFAPAEP